MSATPDRLDFLERHPHLAAVLYIALAIAAAPFLFAWAIAQGSSR